MVSRDHRRLRVVFHIVLILLSSVARATGIAEEAASSPDTQTITDAAGRTVTVPTDPQRIVTAGSAVLMIADALYLFPGAGDRLIGVGRINQGKGNFLAAIDPDYQDKAILERNVGPEQIASLNPDLVILKSTMRERLGDAVEQLGLPVVYVNLETPEQYQSDLLLLGQLLGQPERAQTLVDYYATITELVRERATERLQSHEAPSVLFLYADRAGGEVAFNIPPAGWIQTQLVELAGGYPVWADEHQGRGWRTIGMEQIASWNPDIITLVAYRQDVGAIRASLVDQPIWQELDAVPQRFLIFPLDFYSWDQPDVRWILGLQWLSAQFDRYSGRAPDIDVVEAMYEFFLTAYGLDRENTEETIVPLLEGVE